MNVKLVRYTKDPLQTIIDAYRRCHLSEEKSDSQCECLGESDEKLLKKCIKLGHHSPLEFVDFEFDITLSKVADRQLCRHRMASYAGESMRYVTARDYFTPKTIFTNDKAMAIYMASILHSFSKYQELIENGVKIEDARYVLPLATTGKFLYKTNLRSLRNAIAERTCKYAQTEIREIFLQIKELVASIQPIFLYRTEKMYSCEVKCGQCMRVI